MILKFRIQIIIFSLIFSIKTFAQNKIHLEFEKADTVFVMPAKIKLPPKVILGGISALEYHFGRFYMVSDRAFNTKIDQNSYVFSVNKKNRITKAYRFYGVNNVEAFRVHKRKTYFANETHDSTGVGYIDKNHQIKYIANFSMHHESLTSDNRGIESLCFGNDHRLWFAFESSKTGNVQFRKYNKNLDSYEIFYYPFEARNCINEKQKLNGNLGNGITEIMAYGKQNNQLIVMERCFEGTNATIKIYLATLKGQYFTKQEIFSFEPNNSFGTDKKPIKTDNMEGMCWSKNKKHIYIVSDDNFNPKYQRTIMLKLKLLKSL